MLGKLGVTVIAAVLAGGLASVAQPSGAAHAAGTAPTLSSSKLTVAFSATDPEQVTSLVWTDSGGATSSNLAQAGGAAPCGSPAEFFGESYGAPENTLPVAVFEGHLASSKLRKGVLKVTGAKKDCAGNVQAPKVDSSYTVGRTGFAANTLTVTRTFAVKGVSYGSSVVGIRGYIPRLAASVYTEVLVPNAGSSGVSTQALCDADCFFDGTTTTTWNGTWFADLAPGSGDAMIVTRAASDETPAELDDNQDGASASNGTSVVLVQPEGGYTTPVKETETLCFVDLTTWPQSMRNAGKEPTGC